MNKFTHLKILVFIQVFAFTLFIVAFSYPVDELLPPILQEYLLQEESIFENNSTPAIIFIVGVLILLLINLVALISLLFKKVWAKKAYVYTTFFFLPITLILGPTVEHAICTTLDDIIIFGSGMLVALLIYTNPYEKN
ncbi:MAG: Unknown protein [uncultured Sulfurovum sp.]|uniref:DUF2127 domain-containing protein n=1 Tax=uncultured Sulfurovum sp. TaxID=269237 RepID=A0A6S6SNA9_9BACT|nr:MAG: Unknown protein [uncultured Sulfurovum sp.]